MSLIAEHPVIHVAGSLLLLIFLVYESIIQKKSLYFLYENLRIPSIILTGK